MYALAHYPQDLGDSEQASLLVAFSNLLERYDEGVDPVTLKHYFDQQNVTGPYDASTISLYDGNIRVIESGLAYNAAIVELDHQVYGKYYSLASHIDSELKLHIIDSIDGQLKQIIASTYKVYAAYTRGDAPELVSSPIVYVTNTIAGIQFRRLKDAPKQLYVRKPEGTMLMDFEGQIDTHRDFIGVPGTHQSYGDSVRVMGIAHHPVLPSGADFYITLEDWANFTGTGKPAHMRGYYTNDLSEAKPAALPPKTTSLPTPTHQNVVRKLTLQDLGFTWLRADHQPVKYRVMKYHEIRDFTRIGPMIPIKRGDKFDIYGTFRARERTYCMPQVRLNGEFLPLFDNWYGIPETDLEGNRVIEEIPDYSDVQNIKPTVEEKKLANNYGFTDHIVDLALRIEVYVKHGIFRVKRQHKEIKK